MFNNPGERNLAVCIIDYSITLIVADFEMFILETEGTVFKTAQTVIKESIKGTGINDMVRQRVKPVTVRQIIFIQSDLCTGKHAADHFGISTDGNPLIQRIEVIIIKRKANRKSSDDKGRKLGTRAPPLLFGVTFDQFFIDVPADKGDRLFLQITGLSGNLSALFRNFRRSFIRCDDAPHLIKSIHIKREGIEFPPEVGYGRVCETVERRKAVYISPYFRIVGMENMRTITMDEDSVDLFGMNIAGNMRPSVNHEDFFSAVSCFTGKDSTVKAGTDDQVIILHVRNLLRKYITCKL